MRNVLMIDSHLLGKIFGAAVRKERKEQGIKQAVLAEAVGYSRPRLSEIERGALPPFDKAILLAQVLGVSLDHLLAPLAQAARPCRSPPTFRERLRQATPQEQQLLIDAATALLDEVKLHCATP